MGDSKNLRFRYIRLFQIVHLTIIHLKMHAATILAEGLCDNSETESAYLVRPFKRSNVLEMKASMIIDFVVLIITCTALMIYTIPSLFL